MAKISKSAAKERIERLREEINGHNYNYYVLNSPVISDFEFDLMLQELASLEKMFPEFASADSPTMKVGSDIAGKKTFEFATRTHRYPMLSLGNTYSREELAEFSDRITKTIPERCSYSCELKFDGTAICLTYRHGRLAYAVTRGDGVKGDDVTANVMTIKSIPQQLEGDSYPDEFEIRGEIYMPFDAFNRLNAEREEIDERPFANPRNAASGSLKLQDCSEVATRGLACVLYHMLGEDLPFTTHSEAIAAAKSWGLPVSEHSKVVDSIDGVYRYIDYWDTERRKLPFPIDGIVIKVNRLDWQRRLGYTAKSPRWATAYKFKPDRALTKLLSIDYQVGRTGAITPVANLDPVPLSGTIVKRASLHNKDQMDLLDIRVGDFVYVEKGGEIIPKITEVDLSKRPADAAVPAFPRYCPDCGAELVRDEGQAKHYCPNSNNCPVQIKSGFVHFISRKAMDILAGDATIDQLYDKGYIRHLSDLYSLTKEQLLTLDGWKDRSAENLLASLEKSKSVPFNRVFYALGIRHVGEANAKLLAAHFGSIDAIMAADRDALVQIDEVGDIMADSIIRWFADPVNLEQIQKLKQAGLKFEQEKTKKVSDTLSGSIFVVSGVFSVSREEIKQFIESHGGKTTSSVSGHTTYLVAGEAPGGEKIKKAEKLGTKIITEEQLRGLVADQI
ncbi:MAG: NAD-dependent DNA ligase LigA [Bacteroidales bacterium]|nr:NAD-dependent DNA ligase LigA [Bacteroidales bacterium]